MIVIMRGSNELNVTFMMTSDRGGDTVTPIIFTYLFRARVESGVCSQNCVSPAAECFLSISDEKCLNFFHFYVNSFCAGVWTSAISVRLAGRGRSQEVVKRATKSSGRAAIRSMLASFFAPTHEFQLRLRPRRLGPDNEAAPSVGEKRCEREKMFTCGFRKLGHKDRPEASF